MEDKDQTSTIENDDESKLAMLKILLEPCQYIAQLPSQQLPTKFIKAFNLWMNIPDDKLNIIEDLMEMLHSASLLIDDIEDNSKLRSGIPVAHHIYGTPLTMNAANYTYFLALQKALQLDHPQVAEIFTEQMIQFHHGQGTEIWWRENFVSPSEDEYRQMVIRKCGSLFHLGVRLMLLFLPEQIEPEFNFDHLCNLLALFFQIRADYSNLNVSDISSHKAFAEDLTEGKFSFPILHAVNTRDTDTRLIHILKQRTQNIELKQYCIDLLNEFGSMDYTRQTCEQLAQDILNEIDALGGNDLLETIMREQMKIFLPHHHQTDPDEDDRYVTDQIDEDDDEI